MNYNGKDLFVVFSLLLVVSFKKKWSLISAPTDISEVSCAIKPCTRKFTNCVTIYMKGLELLGFISEQDLLT